MAEIPAPATLVTAVYSFKGSNNDELCFRKGDVITITQAEEGGWWEGTLGGKTGWFPCNYVTIQGGAEPAKSVVDIKRGSVINYHQMVVQSLVDSERNYVTELQEVIQNYLHPIHTGHYLSQQQYKHLVGNLDELVKFHLDFLTKLEHCVAVPYIQQRVGGLFLKTAPQLKLLYEDYFSNHPWAVQIMLSKKDDLNVLMESKGVPSPGTMELTTCLSKPFTRMDQYASTLKELERHIEDCHPDRGDTQRALAVCKDIAAGCVELRKQKEVECEIRSDMIDGIDDEMCQGLGSLVYLGNVMLSDAEKRHAVLALFDNQILFLYISSCMSGYEFQGKMAVSAVSVTSLDDTDLLKHAFEITAGKEKRTVLCLNGGDKKKWMDLFTQLMNSMTNNLNKSAATSTSSVNKIQPAVLSPKLPHRSELMSAVGRPAPPHGNAMNGRPWSMSCLRPSAPRRPAVAAREAGNQSPKSVRKQNSQRRKAVEEMKTLEEDALILQVIEAYCTSSRTRHTVNSSMVDGSSFCGGDRVLQDSINDPEERTFVETVFVMRDQMILMRDEQRKLRTEFNNEVRTRRKLETFLKKTFRSLTSMENGE